MSNGGLRRFLWLVIALLLPACGGGGSTAVPHSTSSVAPSGSAATTAQGGYRIALRMVLGKPAAAAKTNKAAAAQKRRPDFSKAKGYARAMQIDAAKRTRATKSATAKRRTASASTRSPQYINEAATDTINVYVNGGSATGYDVSFGNTATYGGTQLSSQPCQFLNDGAQNDTTRECTFAIPAPAGADTFYVTAFCTGCGDGTGADLAAGLTTATIVSGAAQSISITLQPFIDTSQSDIELGTPTPVGSANIGLPVCPGNSCWLYDLDAGLGSGAAPVGDLELNLVDASDLPIPPQMPNPDPSALVNGVAPAANNTDPFAVLPTSDPASSLANDTFSIGSITEVNGSGGHVYYGTDASCASSTTLSTTSWTNAYAFGQTQFPYVCYDNNASYNGDAEQYYATLSAATTLGTIATVVITPVFAPAPDSSACVSLEAGEACQEIAQYGLGYVSLDVSACSSSYFTFTTDQGSISGGDGNGLYSFRVDGHGYTEVAIAYSGSNDSDSCQVTYYTDDGAIVNRTYTAGEIDGNSNSGGSTNGNIDTVFGHKRKAH